MAVSARGCVIRPGDRYGAQSAPDNSARPFGGDQRHEVIALKKKKKPMKRRTQMPKQS